MTGGRIGRTTAVIFAALLVGPGSAQADDFYASPTGTGAPPCTSAAPCSIHGASAAAIAGVDEVLLNPGTYTLTSNLETDTPMKPLVSGDRPAITSTTGDRVTVNGANGSIEDVRIDISGMGVGVTAALTIVAGGADRVEVISQGGNFASGVSVRDGGVLENSTVRTLADSARAIITGGTPPSTSTIRNVTAISFGATSVGLEAFYNQGETQDVTVVNSILRGTQTNGDIVAEDNGGNDIDVNVDYSNYRLITETNGGNVIEGANNQSAAPQFLDGNNGDFHQLSTSPTVDAGTSVPSTLDLDGQARAADGPDAGLVADTDIGADEMVAPGNPTLTATSPGSGADDNNPEFLGSSDPAIVSLHPDPACEQPLVATGLWSAFAAPGLTVTVPDNSTTTLYAIATLGSEETTSDCSAGLSYQEATPIPPIPPPGVQSLTPSLNQRAVAIKRCKRKFPKGSKKRKKCLRRARRLPL